MRLLHNFYHSFHFLSHMAANGHLAAVDRRLQQKAVQI